MNEQDQVINYLLNELSPEDKSTFEKRLVEDDNLKRELETYNQLLFVLDNEKREVPSHKLQKRFDRFLETRIRKQSEGSNKIVRLRTWKIAGIAASILLLGIWIGSGLLGDRISAPSLELVDENTATVSMNELVSSPSSSYRIRGVNMAYSLNNLDNDLLKTLETVLYTDRSSNVRLAAAEALVAYADDPEVREILLKALVEVDDPVVRISLIAYMTGVGESRAVPEFEKLLDDDQLDKAVRDELHAGLIKLM